MRCSNSCSAPYCSAVRDVSQLALVALLVILTFRWTCSAAPPLSGEWESTIAVESQAGTWSIETDCTIEMVFVDWSASARTVFEDDAWKKQDFEIKGKFGDVDLESDFRFEPYKSRFKDWIIKFEWEWNELAFTLITKLTRTNDWLIFEIEREWNAVEIDTSFRLRAPSGSCALVFYDAGLDAAFDWCGIEIDLEFAFDDDGFDKLIAEFSDLNLAPIPWLTFDLEITRTLEKTTVKLSPDVVLESSLCAGILDLEFEGSFPNEPNLLPLSIDEACLTWEIEGWEIEANVYFNPDDWVDDLYWLEIDAEAAFDLDTGEEMSLDLTLLWTETKLGRMRPTLTYEPSDKLSIAVNWDIDLDDEQLDSLALELQTEW
ncbi:hypothetical protein ACFLS0_06380 [Candidatus Bipolaricaulota bacterium]